MLKINYFIDLDELRINYSPDFIKK